MKLCDIIVMKFVIAKKGEIVIFFVFFLFFCFFFCGVRVRLSLNGGGWVVYLLLLGLIMWVVEVIGCSTWCILDVLLA